MYNATQDKNIYIKFVIDIVKFDLTKYAFARKATLKAFKTVDTKGDEFFFRPLTANTIAKRIIIPPNAKGIQWLGK